MSDSNRQHRDPQQLPQAAHNSDQQHQQHMLREQILRTRQTLERQSQLQAENSDPTSQRLEENTPPSSPKTNASFDISGQTIKDYYTDEKSNLTRQNRFDQIKKHATSNKFLTDHKGEEGKTFAKTVVEPIGLDTIYTNKFVNPANLAPEHIKIIENMGLPDSLVGHRTIEERAEAEDRWDDVQKITHFKYTKVSLFSNIALGGVGFLAPLLSIMMLELSKASSAMFMILVTIFGGYLVHAIASCFFSVKIDKDGVSYFGILSGTIKWKLVESVKLRYHKSLWRKQGLLTLIAQSGAFTLKTNSSLDNFPILVACFAQAIRLNNLPIDVISLNNFAMVGHLFSHIDSTGTPIFGLIDSNKPLQTNVDLSNNPQNINNQTSDPQQASLQHTNQNPQNDSSIGQSPTRPASTPNPPNPFPNHLQQTNQTQPPNQTQPSKPPTDTTTPPLSHWAEVRNNINTPTN